MTLIRTVFKTMVMTVMRLLVVMMKLQSSDMQTEPPPRANFCETVNQWVIYDR